MTKRAASKALEERMNNEAEGADPEVLAKFRREHGGMDPLQYALAQFPKSSEPVYQERPDLRPPKKKPPPAGSR